MKQIICPNCKGTKVKDLGNKYRCLYCGTTFSVEEKRDEEQPAQQQASPVTPQVIYIQQQPVQQQPSAQPQNPVPEKNFTTTTGFKVFIAVVVFIVLLLQSC